MRRLAAGSAPRRSARRNSTRHRAALRNTLRGNGMRPYHLLFDLDGTLTDPAPGIIGCLLHAVRDLGCSSASSAELRRFIGPPLREVFAELLDTRDEARIEEGVRLYRERFSSVGLFENAVYPGVEAALAELREHGFSFCLVTSKPKVYADRIIDHFELRAEFPRVYGAELSGERSSKAELIAHALEREGLQPAQACMIGDRSHDVLGARANGVTALGVSWGYGTRAELEAAGADRVIDRLEELLPALSALRLRSDSGAESQY
jgi:phosphoglycolate phosphatase